MTAQELLDSLPEGLRGTLQIHMFDREIVPTVGFPELRQVAVHVYLGGTITRAVLAEAEAKLPAWLERQELAQARQGGIIEAIFEKYPLDDPENVPDWPWLPWGPLIREDWSDELTDSLDAAEAHLQD
jgi:hypothetical protein